MGINWVQGQTYTLLPLTLKQTATSALDLTGVSTTNITVKVKRKDGRAPTTYTALAGTASISNATTGSILYQFADADVAVAGEFYLLVQVNMPNAKVWKSMPVDFTIQAG